MKVGDLVERRYETGQYGPNAIGLVIELSTTTVIELASCETPQRHMASALFQYADDGTTDWVSIEDLEVINESR